ncbi:hypothetical protein HYS50_01745 [Candidatus Woesearchaeota archaeon]|nr:hypothetical protein [Candidatus Woesearchaeota archaeon]
MRHFLSRAQISFEYLALAGILLAILIPIIYTSLSTVYDQHKISSVDDIVSQLASKADDVYKLGPGNKDTLQIVIPAGITGATVAGNEISLQTTLRNQNATVRKFTEPNVIGSFDIMQGEYYIPIKALNHSLVRIGSGPFLLNINPSCIEAPSFANPQTITIYGDDFSSTSILLKNNVPFTQTLYQVVDAGTLTFIANPTEFPVQPPPSGTPFNFTVTDKGKTSNLLIFLVFPSPQKCP